MKQINKERINSPKEVSKMEIVVTAVLVLLEFLQRQRKLENSMHKEKG